MKPYLTFSGFHGKKIRFSILNLLSAKKCKAPRTQMDQLILIFSRNSSSSSSSSGTSSSNSGSIIVIVVVIVVVV